MLKSAIIRLLQAAWIASLLGCAAGVVLHNDTVNGFSCSVLVRGSMPVEAGSAFADQGPFVNNTLYLWRDWVNEEMGGLTVSVGEDGELRQCGVDLVIEEDHSDVALVAEIMEKYVDEADFLIAPYGSTLTAPAIPITYDAIHPHVWLCGAAKSCNEFWFGLLFLCAGNRMRRSCWREEPPRHRSLRKRTSCSAWSLRRTGCSGSSFVLCRSEG